MPKADKLLESLSNIIKVKGELDRIMKIPQSVNLGLKTHNYGQIEATNDNLNKLRAIGNRWSNQLSSLGRKDENWWIDWSGTHALLAQSSSDAIRKILQVQKKINAFKSACSGLITLVYTVFTADNADIKGLAKAYCPSLIAIDAIVAKEAATNFKACEAHCKKILETLARVIPLLQSNYRHAKGVQQYLRQ